MDELRAQIYRSYRERQWGRGGGVEDASGPLEIYYSSLVVLPDCCSIIFCWGYTIIDFDSYRLFSTAYFRLCTVRGSSQYIPIINLTPCHSWQCCHFSGLYSFYCTYAHHIRQRYAERRQECVRLGVAALVSISTYIQYTSLGFMISPFFYFAAD